MKKISTNKLNFFSNKVLRVRIFNFLNATNLFLILIIILLASGIVFFHREDQVAGDRPLILPTMMPIPPTTMPMPTSIWHADLNYLNEKDKHEYKWNTYKNDSLGFEFFYPDLYSIIQENDGQTVFSLEPGLPAIIISTNPKDFINFDIMSSKLKIENADSSVSNIKKEAINFGGHKAIRVIIEDSEYPMYVIQTQESPVIQIQFLLAHKMWDSVSEDYVISLKQRTMLMTSSFMFNDADAREGKPDRIVPVETKKTTDSMDDYWPYRTEAIYTSTRLGIKFTFTYDFAPYINSEGNKICWEDGPADRTQAHKCFVHAEVFSKTPSQTLREAIEEKILTGYDKNKCLIDIVPDDNDNNKEIATIYFAFAKTPYKYWQTGVDGPWENPESCPSYTQKGPIQYFMSDKNFPDKFVYFLIMHQSYPSATEMMNLEFIK